MNGLHDGRAESGGEDPLQSAIKVRSVAEPYNRVGDPNLKKAAVICRGSGKLSPQYTAALGP
jgi:hypothetical protein